MKFVRKNRVFWVLALIAACAAGLFLVKAAEDRKPTVSERWALYVQNLKPEPKLVVLSSLQKYQASKEFTTRLLAIVNVRASIELSAWADVSYYIDVSDASKWSVDWDKKSRILTLAAPAPDCLPPAVRTETIEIRTKGSNLVTNTVFRLKSEAEKMKDELSADLLVRARASLSDEAVRAGIREGLGAFARTFCKTVLKAEPREVHIRLPGD